jgi:uncharacterized membrane protein
MKLQISRIASLLLTGLIAGTFIYGTYCVLPAFYEVSPETHLHFRTALMHHNKTIVMAMVLLALLAITLYCVVVRKIRIVRTFCLAALLLTLVSLVITRLGSVPINMQIKTWIPSSPPVYWLKTLDTWNFYNLVRTISSLLSFICLLVADVWLIHAGKSARQVPQ